MPCVPGGALRREGHCNLFDQSEIDRWNRQMWQAERAQEVERGQIMVQVSARRRERPCGVGWGGGGRAANMLQRLPMRACYGAR